MSNLIERLRGYPGMSLEKLLEGMTGRHYGGLAKEAADEIERLSTEGAKTRAIADAAMTYFDLQGLTIGTPEGEKLSTLLHSYSVSGTQT